MSKKINLALIESYIGENFLSYTEFCKRCNISMPTLNKIMRGEHFRMTALVKIAQVLNVQLSDLIIGD